MSEPGDVPWMVRPDTVNPRFPWAWFCEGRIREGLLDRPCSACGPARTKEQATATAREHACETHGYLPDAAGEGTR